MEGWSSAVDRLRRFPGRCLEALQRPKFVAEGIDPSTAPKEEAACVGEAGGAAGGAAAVKSAGAGLGAAAPAAGAAAGKAATAAAAADKWAVMNAKCGPLLEQLQSAEGDGERRTAQVAFNYCMGRELCPDPAAAFMKALEASKAAGKAGEAGGEEEKAFAAMMGCLVKEAEKRKSHAAAALK